MHTGEDQCEFLIRRTYRTEFSAHTPVPTLIYSYIHSLGHVKQVPPEGVRQKGVSSVVPNSLIVSVGVRGVRNLRNRCKR